MPLFELANAQPSFQNPLFSLRAQLPCYGKLSSIAFTFGGYDQSVPGTWKSLDKLKKVNFNVGHVELRRCRSLIKAVATLEPKSLTAKEDGCMGSKDLELGLNPDSQRVLPESSDEESSELDDREKLRRMRISEANKGNTPWNKGRKHSPETLQKIRERTRLAMQNPKVKMKLANLGHAQTTETRRKIGAGVKVGWERRREKKVVQDICYFEWQNLITEASRQGYAGQEELQWNSYETLDEQLKQEWLESVEQRKQMPRAPGSRRAPKSLEQRRKIAESISAKWADPDYRRRVCSAMAKYHGTEDAERKPRRRPNDGAKSTKRNPVMKKDTDTNKSGTNIRNQILLKKRNYPAYKDPLVSSKLEMIKNIRAQRAATEMKQIEAIELARLLIAEAEKAAKALEAAALKSPIAHASLLETRKLISEAIQTLESIDAQAIITESNVPSVASREINNEKDAALEEVNQSHVVQVNGHQTLSSSDYKFSKDFGKFSFQKLINGDLDIHLASTNGYSSLPLGFNGQMEEPNSSNQQRETEENRSCKYKTDPSPSALEVESIKDETASTSPVATKKWVRGKLVEVVEEKQ